MDMSLRERGKVPRENYRGLLVVVESDPLWCFPLVGIVVPLLLVVAALDGGVLEEDVVGGGVLAVLLPAGLVLVPETGLAGLLTVNVALQSLFFRKKLNTTYEGIPDDQVDDGHSEEDETDDALPQVSLLQGLGDGLVDVSTVEGKLNGVDDHDVRGVNSPAGRRSSHPSCRLRVGGVNEARFPRGPTRLDELALGRGWCRRTPCCGRRPKDRQCPSRSSRRRC